MDSSWRRVLVLLAYQTHMPISSGRGGWELQAEKREGCFCLEPYLLQRNILPIKRLDQILVYLHVGEAD